MTPTKDEVRAAARELIRDWGMGRYSAKKSPREKRRRAKLARNAIVAGQPVPEAQKCFVYVISADAGPVKIGIAIDPHQRLAGVQTGHPEKLRLAAVFGTHSVAEARSAERECHRRLAKRRMNGEWFDCDRYAASELVKQVVSELAA